MKIIKCFIIIVFLSVNLCGYAQEDIIKLVPGINPDIIAKAEKGDKLSQYLLGEMLWSEGKRYEKKGLMETASLCLKESYFWVKKSAQQGFSLAQYSLGRCYEDGDGTKVDYKKAIRWYESASKQGASLAGYQIGLCYEKGRGVKKDYQKAIECYLKVIERDSAIVDSCGVHWLEMYDGAEFAKERIGYLYENGLGVSINFIEAMKWYRKATRFMLHQYNLGIKYFQGVIVSQNYKEAFKWFEKSAGDPPDYWAGYDSSIYMLGYMYEFGYGTRKDKSKAIQLYRVAAQKGHSEAKLRLANINGSEYNIVSNDTPYLYIVSPQNGSFYDGNIVTFKIKTSDNVKIYVEIDGAPAVEVKRTSNKGAKISEGESCFVDNLPTITDRTTNLVFFARGNSGTESERQRVTLRYVGQVVKPKLFLFAVGVSDYVSKDVTKLRYAAKDACDFANTIEQSSLDDYKALKKYIYINKAATRKNIINGLNELSREVRQGDVVMFFFSGHGHQDYDETYFMTINASMSNPSDEGINFADLRNNMRKLTERQVKVIAFMDACHAGAMVGAKGAAPKLTELNVENVIEFYSSTKGEESAEDEKLQNGVFTAGLISGLKGAAANADGYITVNTLRAYLSDYVRNHNSRQTPVFKGVDAGDITLFQNK